MGRTNRSGTQGCGDTGVLMVSMTMLMMQEGEDGGCGMPCRVMNSYVVPNERKWRENERIESNQRSARPGESMTLEHRNHRYAHLVVAQHLVPLLLVPQAVILVFADEEAWCRGAHSESRARYRGGQPRFLGALALGVDPHELDEEFPALVPGRLPARWRGKHYRPLRTCVRRARARGHRRVFFVVLVVCTEVHILQHSMLAFALALDERLIRIVAEPRRRYRRRHRLPLAPALVLGAHIPVDALVRPPLRKLVHVGHPQRLAHRPQGHAHEAAVHVRAVRVAQRGQVAPTRVDRHRRYGYGWCAAAPPAAGRADRDATVGARVARIGGMRVPVLLAQGPEVLEVEERVPGASVVPVCMAQRVSVLYAVVGAGRERRGQAGEFRAR
ncbi:hypothetical protein B0H10DRAFT_283301 [Mycena sp. CBHHK59/15]|nr:hypothetical protein B0H10DRAFT_283301 [Mycena sp. CBHHK59/15]